MAGLKSDPLFGGLTRPATMLGLPVEALLCIFMLSVVGFLVSGMISDEVAYKANVILRGVDALPVVMGN